MKRGGNEKSIEQLQEIIAKLSLKVEKLEAIDQIKKTMASYEYWHYPDIFEKKMQACWCWGKYCADFINKDGKWLIWHLYKTEN